MNWVVLGADGSHLVTMRDINLRMAVTIEVETGKNETGPPCYS